MAIRVRPAPGAGKGSHRIERGAMNVYVESNFVLDQALEQDQCESCEQLIGLASTKALQLVIPAFSLAEPHATLLRTKNARSRLSNDLLPHLRELARVREQVVTQPGSRILRAQERGVRLGERKCGDYQLKSFRRSQADELLAALALFLF